MVSCHHPWPWPRSADGSWSSVHFPFLISPVQLQPAKSLLC